MPKVKFFSEVPLLVGTPSEIPAGTVIATVETPDGLDVRPALNAILRGLATENAPKKAKAEAAPKAAPAAPAAEGK